MESLGNEISWPSKKPQEKQSRIHNHHVSLRGRIKELQSRSHGKHPRVDEQIPSRQETTKAVAWAVFQHHGEGGVNHSHTHGMAVRRPTRFKIEALMKHEVAHRSVYEAVAFRWDAGSTLFDSFELNSLLKTLDEAAHSRPVGMAEQSHADEDREDAGAMIVYSSKFSMPWTTRPQLHAPSERHSEWSLGDYKEDEDYRLDTVDEMRSSKAHGEGQRQRAVRYNPTGNLKHGHDDLRDVSISDFGNWYAPKSIVRRSFDSTSIEKPAKGGSHSHHHHHHHNRWKNVLHKLHLDGANGLFHGFHKSHTQVSPHDLEKPQDHRGRNHRDGSYGDAHLDTEPYEGHFVRNDLYVSKDVNPSEKEHDHHHHHHRHRHSHHLHFWKFDLKTALTQPFCRAGHHLSDNEGSDSEKSCHQGHKKHHGHKHGDLRAAWSSLTANLLHHHHHHEHKHQPELQGAEQFVIEHHYHHHVQPEDEDDEMTVQAISMRVARTSFDEKVRRLSIEDGGLKAPRNSLEAPTWVFP